MDISLETVDLSLNLAGSKNLPYMVNLNKEISHVIMCRVAGNSTYSTPRTWVTHCGLPHLASWYTPLHEPGYEANVLAFRDGKYIIENRKTFPRVYRKIWKYVPTHIGLFKKMVSRCLWVCVPVTVSKTANNLQENLIR